MIRSFIGCLALLSTALAYCDEPEIDKNHLTDYTRKGMSAPKKGVAIPNGSFTPYSGHLEVLQVINGGRAVIAEHKSFLGESVGQCSPVIIETNAGYIDGSKLNDGLYVFKGTTSYHTAIGNRTVYVFAEDIRFTEERAKQILKRVKDEEMAVFNANMQSTFGTRSRKQERMESPAKKPGPAPGSIEVKKAPPKRPLVQCKALYSDGRRCQGKTAETNGLCVTHRKYDPKNPPYRLDEEEPINDEERVDLTRHKLERIKTSVEAYAQRNAGRVPRDWNAFRLGLPMDMLPPRKDGWRGDFYYESDGELWIACSPGIDHKLNTKDDLIVSNGVREEFLQQSAQNDEAVDPARKRVSELRDEIKAIRGGVK